MQINLAERAVALRNALGENQTELALRLGVSRNYVSMLERGKEVDEQSSLYILFSVLEEQAKSEACQEPHELTYLANEKISDQPSEIIPVVGWAHAGEAMCYDEMPVDYLESLPMPSRLKGKKAFGLIVDGDSMVPVVCSGDRIAVLKEDEIWSGCLVVSKFNNDEGVLIRRLQRLSPSRVRLMPYNVMYQATEHDLEEFEWIRPVAFIYRDTMNPNGH